VECERMHVLGGARMRVFKCSMLIVETRPREALTYSAASECAYSNAKC
jgi:hypothetical protein